MLRVDVGLACDGDRYGDREDDGDANLV